MNGESIRSEKQIKKIVQKSFRNKSINGQPWHEYFLGCLKINDRIFPTILNELSANQKLYIQKTELRIWLWDNQIGDKGCLYLSNKTQLSHLTVLNLSNSKIGDRGCQYIGKGNWPELEYLNIKSNQVTQKGCISLSKSNWNKLKRLYTIGNPIGQKGYMTLRRRFNSQCMIWTNLEYTDE